jgi:hypothetical protein
LPCATGARQRPKSARHSLCRANSARAHSKGCTTHFCPGKDLPCAIGKDNAQHRSLSCATCDARQRKGVDGCPQRDDINRSLSCATQILMAQKKKKTQGRPGPASARPQPRRRRPPVLRSPRQRHHHHHTPSAPLGPPPPHLDSSAGSLGRRASREGVVAPRPDPWPLPLRPGRGGREPPPLPEPGPPQPCRRGSRDRRNRRDWPGAKEEGRAGRGHRVQGGGRGRSWPAGGAECGWGEGGVWALGRVGFGGGGGMLLYEGGSGW